MKYRKLRFLSVVCVASLLISQGVIAAYSVGNDAPGSASGYMETESTPITADQLTINIGEKEYDGSRTAVADITLSNDILKGKDVTVGYSYAEYDSPNAGKNRVVTIEGLHLEGEDKDAFQLQIDEQITVGAIIKERTIELAPKSTQPHFSNESYPMSVEAGVVTDRIVSGDEVNDIPTNIFIVKSEDKYYYSLEETKIVTEKVLSNTNYKVEISSSSQVNVVVPNAPVLNNAILSPVDNRVEILFYEGIGFATKGKVNVKLSAQPMYGEELKYYVKSDENNYVEEALQGSDLSLDTIGSKKFRTVDVRCAVEEKVKNDYSQLTYEYNGNISQTLFIDKEKPTNKNDKPLALVTKNESQQLLLSGTVCDNGSGIASVSYKWKNNGSDIKRDISNFQTGTNELSINSVSLMNYSELPDDNKITVTVTDLAGNSKGFKLSYNADDVRFAEPSISEITLEGDKGTDLDKILNILSFGIYSKNKKLTLKIKASPSEIAIEDNTVTVSLMRKNEDGKMIVFNDKTQTEKVDNDTVFTFSIEDETVADQLSVKLENAYGGALTVPLKKALESGQWNENTTKTESDKWVFDKNPPQISLSLNSRTAPEYMDEDEYFNPCAINKDYGQFEIVASDSSGIESLAVYNDSENTYTISDTNKKEYCIVDDKGNEYSITKLIDNGFIISDGENSIEVSVKKETITVDNPDDPENLGTKDVYSIVDNNNVSFSFADENSEYTLEDVKGKNSYVIKNDDITTDITINEIHNFYQICDQYYQDIDPAKENTTVRCVILSDGLPEGENVFVVLAKDNAGNTSEIEYTVDVLKDLGMTTLKLLSPVPNTQMLTDEGQCWVKESAIEENIKEEVDPEPEQEVLEKYPLTFKFSLSSEEDLDNLSSIKYYIVKNDESDNNDKNNKIHITEWDVKSSNKDKKITDLEQVLQLPKKYYDNRILETKNYSKNIIHIRAEITNVGGNSYGKGNTADSGRYLNELIVHVDKESPEIGTFKVSRTNDSVKDIIHILTFGIFYKDEIKVSAEIKDAESDAGIESVKFYDLEGTEFTGVQQEEQNSNSYYIILPGDTQIYQTGINVVATDKLGNKSYQSLNTSNVKAEGGGDLNANLVLIESNPPVAEIDMPVPTHEANSQKWFDEADKDISLKVSDSDSGIRSINVTVKDKPVTNAKESSYKLDSVTEKNTDASGLTADGFILSDNKSNKLASKITEVNYIFSLKNLIETAGKEDGSYELVVNIVDNAGNPKTESVTFYRDIEPPEVTGIVFSTADSNGRTDTSVTDDNYKLIDQNQGIKKMDYGYYFQSGFTLKINAKDRSASSGLKKATVTLMEYNDDGTYSENEIKTVNFNTGTKSGTNVEGESESVTIYSGFKGMILAEVTDNTGNVSSKRSPRAFVSDNIKPEISIKATDKSGAELPLTEVRDLNNNNLYTDDISFTVTVTDKKSGLKEIKYEAESDKSIYNETITTDIKDFGDNKIDTDAGDGWIIKEKDLNVVTEVEKTFYYGEIDNKKVDETGIYAKFIVKDNAENSNEDNPKQTSKFTIDRVPPEIKKVSLKSSNGNGTKEAEFSDNGDFIYKYFYNEPFSFTVKAEDKSPSSGLNNVGYKFINYSFDNEGKEISKEIPGGNVSVATGETEPIQSPEEFKKGQISVQAVDNTLVNKSKTKKTHGIVIDNTAPVISIDKLPNTNGENNAVDDDGNVLYNDPNKVSFKVTIEDTESGIKNINYSKTSEKTYGTLDVDTNINTSDDSYKVKSSVGSAENDSDWKIEAMDHNLVTRVSRVFTFNEDDKNIQFSFKAIDRSENNSDTKTSQSFTIDTAAPSVTGIKFSIKTADNISEVKPEEFIEELEYGYYFKEQMVITASCEDSRPSSGLKMLSFRFVPYKDGKQIEQSQYAEPKESDVDEESIKVNQKVVNGKASCTVEKGFKGQIFVTAYDYAAFYYDENASKEITTKAFVIEDNAPTIKIDELPETSLTDDLGNKLYTDKVSFKVTITDTESGLRELSYAKRSDNIEDDKTAKETVSQKIVNNSKDYKVGYKFKNTEWVIERMDNNLVTEVSQTFVFDEDDKSIYMIFGAVDRSNNKAADKNSEKFTIDTVNPTVEKFNFEPASEDNISEVTDFIEELEYGYYFKKSFNAVVTVDDKIPSSGLDKVIFRLVAYENGEYVSEESYSVAVKDKKANYLIPKGFKGQIYAKVFDRAVNESFEETPQAFVVDEVAPVITIEPLPDNNDKTDMDGNKLYAHSVQFKVTVSDTKSGLRNIFYSKSSEKNSFDDVSTQIQNVTQYKEGDEISNGWQITKMDNNLVTEVTQVFTFNDDDNHIVMNYRAIDRSMNSSENVKSESFTIDTTAPVVRVSYPEPVNGMYYKESVTFTFSITERNFDSSLMERTIKDSFRSNNGLQLSYNSSSITEHTATVTFPEGDYEFAYSGEDRGGNRAQFFEEKSTSGFSSFNKSFYVDATNPKIVSADFYGDGEDNLFKKDYYNKDSIPHIKVTIEEHNVSKNSISSYIKLGFKTASSGEAHNVQNLSDTDWYYISNEDWKSLGNDRFSIDIDFNNEKYHDGVYQIIMELTDPAENKGENVQSKIFELDRVVPVLSQRNDENKDFVVSPFVDVYDEKRKDEKAPSLSFYDINFEKLVIKADVFKTKYIEDNQIISMEKDVLSDELSKTYNNESFNLDNYFDDDGVYVFTFTAYDKAGNASKEINDTYFKMVKTDCLAYIANSDAGKHTGYYSLMDNNQRAISKKATDFSDLDITIVTKNDDDNSYSIEIKDNKDQKQHIADDSVTLNSSKIGNSETAVMKEMRLPGSYFSETFKDDSLDARMDLSVLKKPANTGKEKNQSADTEKTTSYYLAKIHIDNEKPSATLPEFFHSWSNVMFTDNVEVTLTNISEKLDMSKTKIYECPREGDRVEIQLTDSNYDESKKKLTFTLSEGIHNIDISLVDEAGNEWNVDRIRYFTVGNLWLYVGIGVVFGIAAIVVTIILIRKNKKSKKKTVKAT